MTSLSVADGWELHWGSEGIPDAPPVLLLPPLGRSRASWQSQTPALTDAYQLLLPDTRGTGDSVYNGDDYSLATFAEDALRLLDHLEIESTHVVGWSMGSAVAQELALLAPERVRSLTLLTPWGQTDEVMHQHFQEMVDAVVSGPSLVGVEALTLELILSTQALAGIDDVTAAARVAVAEPGFPTAEALTGHIRACMRHDTEGRLASLSIPTLVVGGSEDRLIPAHHAENLASTIPSAQLVILEGPLASHALPIEMAVEVNDIVRSHLDRH
jgi:pimeloyl-ACP methyl ester carboxylesterase